MKEIREIDRATLTTEQKLGLVLCANLNHGDADVEYALGMIRERKLGAIWLHSKLAHRERVMRLVRETADYPILIMCDGENGHPDYPIPAPIALSAAHESEEYAHAFGRVTATKYAEMGYNVVCNPLLDRCLENSPCGSVTRTISPKKEVVARLGTAIARGMHEGGVLTVAKHYPSATKGMPYDSHMREGFAVDTREDLEGESLYAYRALNDAGVLDGVMTGHVLLPNIDTERPASLSKPVIDLLRNVGFDGFAITDALNMMGVVLKYGNYKTTPMSIEAGNDIPLPFGIPCREAYEALLEGYRDGMITDERLDEACRRVLDAQHKVMLLPKNTEVLPEDAERVAAINRECISYVSPEGLTPAIDPEGRHLFVLLNDKPIDLEHSEYDAFADEWYHPKRIADTVKRLFPNSGILVYPELPDTHDNMRLFREQQKYEDVVFMTYYRPMCFVGREHLTTRVVDMMDALQSADRIVAHLHFGNPFVATDAPYMPRVILGWGSDACIDHALEILAGNAEPKGVQPYIDLLEFHKKGHVFR